MLEEVEVLMEGKVLVVLLSPALVANAEVVLAFGEYKTNAPVLILIFEIDILSNFRPLL